MHAQRPVGLVPLLLSLAIGSNGPPALGGDSPAEAALKEKGLAKSGRVLVLDDEKPALARAKEVRASFAGYAAIAEKQAAAEQAEAHAAMLEERRVELKASLDALNQRIIEQAASQPAGGPRPGNGPMGGPGQSSPLILQRDQVKAELADVTLGQKALKAESPAVKDKAALDDEVKKKAEAFKSDLADLRAMFDKVTKKYAELAADEAVKKSLNDLEKATKAKLKLGPSDAFLAAARELDQAERRFLGKKAAAPAKKKPTTKAKARK